MAQKPLPCVVYLLAMSLGRGEAAPLDVQFQLTDLEYKPLAGVPVRLVLGDSKGWQEPGAGSRFVTAANGEARFHTEAVIDKRWRSQQLFVVPIPTRTNHLMIAAELERIVPLDAPGKQVRLPLLYTMDIYNYSSGDCSTDEFTNLYAKDQQGRFTWLMPRAGLGGNQPGDAWKLPQLGNLVVYGAGYKPWDFRLAADASGQRWSLKLAFARMPLPVWR